MLLLSVHFLSKWENLSVSSWGPTKSNLWRFSVMSHLILTWKLTNSCILCKNEHLRGKTYKFEQKCHFRQTCFTFSNVFSAGSKYFAILKSGENQILLPHVWDLKMLHGLMNKHELFINHCERPCMKIVCLDTKVMHVKLE